MLNAKLPWTTLSRNVILQYKPLRTPFNHFKSKLRIHPSLNVQERGHPGFRFFSVTNHFEADPSPTIRAESNITHTFRFFKVFQDGQIQFFEPTAPTVPPTDDPETGVQIKDVSISPDVSARMFLPKMPPDSNVKSKLPLVFYIHGGGFCMLLPFAAQYTDYLKRLVAEANVIAVSVDYGLFPARPIPACYEDSWTALQWVASHSNQDGPDPWLNNHADLNRVFISGDSAGGNISHTLVARVGTIGLPSDGLKVVGMILAHPYFGGTEDDLMWLYMCPNNEGLTDPRLKPSVKDLARLGCERVLVFVAEKDHLMGVGKAYVEELNKSGWKGTAEIVENKDRDHGFHLVDYRDEQAVAIQRRVISFINQA